MSTIEAAIKNIQDAKTAEEAFLYFNQTMEQYGYNNNCYTLMNDHVSLNQKAYHGLATSYPEDWLQYYNEKEYQKVDAVWESLLDKRSPFFWQDIIEHQKHDSSVDERKIRLSQKVMNEAEDAGLADGIGISFANSLGEIAGIGLSKEKAENVKNYQEMAEVYLIATVFHDKYLSLFTKPKIPNFSEREKDILLWSAEGKTDWEISKIINISVPTVRFHWKNIFEKTGVNSKTFATTIAIRYKVVTPQIIKSTITTDS
ncbi:MAG: helix-turn-helix transcriptional regulator [Alphaproteobacteria bacterium]